MTSKALYMRDRARARLVSAMSQARRRLTTHLTSGLLVIWHTVYLQ